MGRASKAANSKQEHADNHAGQWVRLPISVLYCKHTHTRLTILCPGLAGWAGTRKTKPMWILIKQETASGSGIDWTICKSAPRSRQITTLTPHHSICYRPDALPAAQRTASKHWRQQCYSNHGHKMHCFDPQAWDRQADWLTDGRTHRSITWQQSAQMGPTIIGNVQITHMNHQINFWSFILEILVLIHKQLYS